MESYTFVEGDAINICPVLEGSVQSSASVLLGLSNTASDGAPMGTGECRLLSVLAISFP